MFRISCGVSRTDQRRVLEISILRIEVADGKLLMTSTSFDTPLRATNDLFCREPASVFHVVFGTDVHYLLMKYLLHVCGVVVFRVLQQPSSGTSQSVYINTTFPYWEFTVCW